MSSTWRTGKTLSCCSFLSQKLSSREAVQVLNRIRRAFTMTGDWDEHLYTAAFNALSASRQVFSVDPKRAIRQLNDTFQALQQELVPYKLDSDTCLDDKDLTHDDYEEAVAAQDSADVTSSEGRESTTDCASNVPDHSPPPTTPFAETSVTLYTNPFLTATAGYRRKSGHYPSFINETEFQEVPEHERVWPSREQCTASVSSKPCEKNVGPQEEPFQAFLTNSIQNVVPPPPLLPSNLCEPQFLRSDAPLHTGKQQYVGTSPASFGIPGRHPNYSALPDVALDTSSFSVPSWVIQALQSSKPPSPECLSFLTAYCWAGYHTLIASSSIAAKEAWLRHLRCFEKRNTVSSSEDFDRTAA